MSLTPRIFNDTITDDTDLVVPADFTIKYIATGNGGLVKLVHFTDLHIGHNFLFDLRLKHTFHGTLDFLDSVVDDGVKLDLYTFVFSNLVGLNRRTNVETNDDCIRCSGKQYITFSNLTNCFMYHLDGNLLCGKLLQ